MWEVIGKVRNLGREKVEGVTVKSGYGRGDWDEVKKFRESILYLRVSK